ncbi:MAG: hypothetical protein HQL23_06140 [Candidatus Omnitrophica bacterium]|nr:hypothetical protein [Candidatus Omnitrophota bacterium]
MLTWNTQKTSGSPDWLRGIFLGLTILVCAWMLYPNIDFPDGGMFAQGDNGLHLYVYSQTAHGALPYHDYWWCYGPLMPFYYAGFLKVLGFTIPSILIGQIVLNILSAVIFFLTLTRFCSLFYAFAAAIFFITQGINFPHTQNHAGGVVLLLALIYVLTGFISGRSGPKNILACSLIVFLLGIIKLNFGVIAGLIVVLARTAPVFAPQGLLPLTPRRSLIVPVAGALGCSFLVYGIFFIGEPFDHIKQNLLFFGNDQVPRISPYIGLYLFFQLLIKYLFANPLLIGLLLLSLFNLYLPREQTEDASRGRTLLLLFLVMVLSLHEYLLSGMDYRWIWAKPSLLLMIFLAAYPLLRERRLLRSLVSGIMVLATIGNALGARGLMNQYRNADHYFNHPRAKAFIANDPAWKTTVLDATRYLQKNLAPQELFFAAPYEPIYYYLLDKPSPVRYLVFFQFLQPTRKQDEEIIRILESKKVNWVVLSNRANSLETGLGKFGVTHCQLLNQYIEKNFSLAAQFGPWDQPAVWVVNHAVRILKRKQPL